MAAIIQPQSQQKRQWPPGHKYGGPCKCDCKLKYIQPECPTSFKPVTTFKPSECKVSDDTTYKMSYYGFDANVVRHCRGTPKILKENISCAGDFSSDTTHKMSYCPWPGYKPPEKTTPTDHCLLGQGPFSQLTTHKHDYTPKPIQDVAIIVHPGNLGFSREPMEDTTTANMSYKMPDYCRFEPATSCKPQKCYVPPRSKMDDKTTHKLSYQPFCPPTKEIYPWARKDKYKPPKVPFDAGTIYNGSYFPPGQFVETCVGPDGCYCMYPGECHNKKGEPPKAHEFEYCPVGCETRRDNFITETINTCIQPPIADVNTCTQPQVVNPWVVNTCIQTPVTNDNTCIQQPISECNHTCVQPPVADVNTCHEPQVVPGIPPQVVEVVNPCIAPVPDVNPCVQPQIINTCVPSMIPEIASASTQSQIAEGIHTNIRSDPCARDLNQDC